MQTSTVFLLLVALSTVGYFLGRQRSFAVAEDIGGVKALHSLPRHYGYMAALWAGIPALLLLIAWMFLESRVITALVSTGILYFLHRAACIELNAGMCVDTDNGAVDCGDRPYHSADEVGVAGRVDQIEMGPRVIQVDQR